MCLDEKKETIRLHRSGGHYLCIECGLRFVKSSTGKKRWEDALKRAEKKEVKEELECLFCEKACKKFLKSLREKLIEEGYES